jgi:DNA-binding Lrp family transcriptional regulator
MPPKYAKLDSHRLIAGQKEAKPMLAKAFVLIETAVGRNKEVANAMKKLKGVKSVDIVTGPYDIIAVLELESLNDVGDLVTGKIHPIAGISRTVTCLAIKTA